MTNITLRSLVVGAATAAALGLTGCDVVPDAFGGGNWRTEARCQPPGGGWGPEHVLPNPATCPEAYAAGSGGGRWAPDLPTYTGPQSDPDGRSEELPCSRTEALNGFECVNVLYPSGNIWNYYPD